MPSRAVAPARRRAEERRAKKAAKKPRKPTEPQPRAEEDLFAAFQAAQDASADAILACFRADQDGAEASDED